MTTATRITLVRIVLIPIYLICMYLAKTREAFLYVSLGVFALASITDFLDGYIARHYHQVTDLGKFLDPLADKALVTAAMAMFCEWGIFPAWALMIVLIREFAVSGLRMIAANKERVIAAGWSGKIKTASTMVGLILMMIWNGNTFAAILGSTAVFILNWFVVVVIAATTLYSGVEYFVKNFDVLK